MNATNLPFWIYFIPAALALLVAFAVISYYSIKQQKLRQPDYFLIEALRKGRK